MKNDKNEEKDRPSDPRREITVPPRAEPGVQAALERITQQFERGMQGLHEDVKGLHTTIRENANQSLNAHETTRKHVDRLAVHVALNAEMTRTLWTDRFGDRPPPSPPENGHIFPWLEGEKKSAPRIPRPSPSSSSTKVSRASSPEIEATMVEQDALKAQMITMDAQLQELLSLQKKQMGIRESTGKRSLVQRFWDALGSRQTQKFVLLFLAAVTSLVTACGTTYALVTGRLPLPNSAAPPRAPSHE